MIEWNNVDVKNGTLNNKPSLCRGQWKITTEAKGKIGTGGERYGKRDGLDKDG